MTMRQEVINLMIMAKNSEKIQPGWQIPKTVKESFDEFCVRHEAVAQGDCAGALHLWQRMPAMVRERAKLEAKSELQVDEGFWFRLKTLIDGATPMLLEAGELPASKKAPKPA